MQLKTQPGLAPPAKRVDFFVSRKLISQYQEPHHTLLYITQEPHYTLLYITTLGEQSSPKKHCGIFSRWNCCHYFVWNSTDTFTGKISL